MNLLISFTFPQCSTYFPRSPFSIIKMITPGIISRSETGYHLFSIFPLTHPFILWLSIQLPILHIVTVPVCKFTALNASELRHASFTQKSLSQKRFVSFSGTPCGIKTCEQKQYGRCELCRPHGQTTCGLLPSCSDGAQNPRLLTSGGASGSPSDRPLSQRLSLGLVTVVMLRLSRMTSEDVASQEHEYGAMYSRQLFGETRWPSLAARGTAGWRGESSR